MATGNTYSVDELATAFMLVGMGSSSPFSFDDFAQALAAPAVPGPFEVITSPRTGLPVARSLIPPCTGGILFATIRPDEFPHVRRNEALVEEYKKRVRVTVSHCPDDPRFVHGPSIMLDVERPPMATPREVVAALQYFRDAILVPHVPESLVKHFLGPDLRMLVILLDGLITNYGMLIPIFEAGYQLDSADFLPLCIEEMRREWERMREFWYSALSRVDSDLWAATMVGYLRMLQLPHLGSMIPPVDYMGREA